MAKYVVGVDGGTGGIRAGLFEIATGEPVGFADTPYETRYPQPCLLYTSDAADE